MKTFGLLIFLLGISCLSKAHTYYVDPVLGHDEQDGKSPDHAWQSLEQVNRFRFQPGDSILFKRNGQWRGQLIPQSGKEGLPITYAAYGSGEKPCLMGSVDMSRPESWIDIGKNRWRSAGTFVTDIGNIIFDGGTAMGVKKWFASDLKSDKDFWFDKKNKWILIVSSDNPAKGHHSVEAAVRRHIIDEQGVSWVNYHDLSLRYGGAHGIGGGNTHHIRIMYCDISYIGGGDIDGKNNVRYGNGIEFWANAHDHLVEGCRIWEIYDSGVTNQNKQEGVSQYQIVYRNNWIWNCSLAAYEFFNRPASSECHDIYFENNTCVNAGYGWGAAQRPDPRGAAIVCWSTTAPLKNMYIRNNIFYHASRTLVFVDTSMVPFRSLQLSHNCYFQPQGTTLLELYPARYGSATFQSYQEKYGADQFSIVADPLFADIKRFDFRLQKISPCINRGMGERNFPDIDRQIRQDGRPDIGAWEYRAQ